jgi:UDP-N-acetylmuramyl pentapeptide phosphotransferase/UDP-N-acetylglucosamine-1-phosphate transferase
MNIFIFCLSIIFIYLLSNFLKKKEYLVNLSGDEHQKFATNNSVPLVGGVFILLGYLLIFFDQNKSLLLFLSLMFLLGLFSDLKIISSAKKRILIQAAIVISFVYFLDLKIDSVRVILFDRYLNIKIINFFFVCFCIIILINGSNFIDGLNGLSLGYYIVVLCALMIYLQHPFDPHQLINLLYLLLILLVFNFLNRLFIGDNGAYILGLIFSYFLITIYQKTPNISPYYIILLLWYPCYELLFSIIRKFNLNYSPIKPDVSHLHQLIYFFIKRKFNLTSLKSNNISSLIILIFNTLIIYLGSKDTHNTQLQVILILLSIFIYTFSYNLALKYKRENK